MKGLLFGASLSLAFILGCVARPLLIPPATAQQANVQKWEYLCGSHGSMGPGGWADKMQATASKAGKEGWDLAGFTGAVYCFKRPL